MREKCWEGLSSCICVAVIARDLRFMQHYLLHYLRLFPTCLFQCITTIFWDHFSSGKSDKYEGFKSSGALCKEPDLQSWGMEVTIMAMMTTMMMTTKSEVMMMVKKKLCKGSCVPRWTCHVCTGSSAPSSHIRQPGNNSISSEDKNRTKITIKWFVFLKMR